MLLWRLAGRGVSRPPRGLRRPRAPAPAGSPPRSGDGGERLWPWFLLYGLTGAVAIGLEVVYFRVVDAILRNNSYTFATVLALYLLLFALGASVGRAAGGARRRGRTSGSSRSSSRSA